MILVAALLAGQGGRSDAQSQWVWTGVTGRLIYAPASHGDRVLDFSNVGYQGNGSQLIPHVPAVISVSPISGDDTANIQAAINQVAQMPLVNGFRGAVELAAGHYDIGDQLTIGASGIVLRGAGSGSDGTVLHGRGTEQRDLIRVLGSGSMSLSGPTYRMTDKVVPAGASSFRVDSAAGLTVGQTVRIRRPGTQAWINEIGMDAPPGGDPGWQPSEVNIRLDRIITRIEGDRVFLDAPLATSFEQRFGGGIVRLYDWNGRIENVGIENLRGESDFNPALKNGSDFIDEDHAWSFISINKAQNVWVRDSLARHFAHAAVRATTDTKWVTVDSVVSEEPVSQVIAERRYTFLMNGQMGFVTNSSAEKGRHDFVNNGGPDTIGPNVFHNSIATDARSDSGPHRRWSTGTLFDNITVQGEQINARNRGSSGGSHGWSGANMVIFNSQADGYWVQNPPTAQNWLIGSSGPILNDTRWGPQPPGHYDSHGTRVTLAGTESLYEAQAADAADLRDFRWSGGVGQWSDALGWDQGATPAVYRISHRDYLLGDIDGFEYDGPLSVDNAYVDSAWAAFVVQSSGQPITGFDDLAGNRNVAFTIQHQLDPGERVVHGFLAMSLQQAASGSAAGDFVRLFDANLAHQLTFNQLGWASQVNPATPLVGVIDMGAYLEHLQNGSVNVQVGTQTGVDWAMYVATVATPVSGAAGARVFLDGGGRTILDGAAAAVGHLQLGGGAGGHLQIGHQALLPVTGDFVQSSGGTLHVEIGEQQFGQLQIDGQAQLGGVLEVTLADGFTPSEGQTFQFLTAADGVSDSFQQLLLPTLAAGLQWNLVYGSESLALHVAAAFLSGDFNRDGRVDAADYVQWRRTGGSLEEYQSWRSNFGTTASSGGSGIASGPIATATQPVPEPAAWTLMLLAAALVAMGRRRRTQETVL